MAINIDWNLGKVAVPQTDFVGEKNAATNQINSLNTFLNQNEQNKIESRKVALKEQEQPFTLRDAALKNAQEQMKTEQMLTAQLMPQIAAVVNEQDPIKRQANYNQLYEQASKYGVNPEQLGFPQTADGNTVARLTQVRNQFVAQASKPSSKNPMDVAFAKQTADQYVKSNDAIATANDALNSLNIMEASLKDINAGPYTGPQDLWARFADPKTAAANKNFDSLVNNLALAAKGNRMQGNFSDQDRRFVLEMVPDRTMSKEAIQATIDIQKDLQKKAIENQQMLQQWVDSGRDIRGFRQWMDQNSLVKSYENEIKDFRKNNPELQNVSDGEVIRKIYERKRQEQGPSAPSFGSSTTTQGLPGEQSSLVNPGLGQVSGKFESGNNYAAANKDNVGWAYGKYQMNSTGQLQPFLQQSGYGQFFVGLKPGTQEFNQRWKQLAQNDPNFAQAQDQHIINNVYKPNAEYAAQKGIPVDDPKIQEALLSTSVQHGGVKKVINMAVDKIQQGIEPLKAIYMARGEYVTRLSNLSASVKRAQLKRYSQEYQMLARM